MDPPRIPGFKSAGVSPSFPHHLLRSTTDPLSLRSEPATVGAAKPWSLTRSGLCIIYMPPDTRSATARRQSTRRDGWHWYDNDGSYDGMFDWVPRHLRVGPWSLLSSFYLFASPLLILYSKPEASSIVLRESVKPYSHAHLVDVALFLWALTVIALCKMQKKTVSGISLSISGWSWLLITARGGAGAARDFAFFVTVLLACCPLRPLRY